LTAAAAAAAVDGFVLTTREAAYAAIRAGQTDGGLAGDGGGGPLFLLLVLPVRHSTIGYSYGTRQPRQTEGIRDMILVLKLVKKYTLLLRLRGTSETFKYPSTL
jgi:hypothetical protein